MLKENLRVALKALAANKLRSVLTTLGIIIGVAAVISLVALGNGVQSFITSQFEAQGANLVYVFPAQVNTKGGANRSGFIGGAPGSRGGLSLSLTVNDAAALEDKTLVPDAALVVPIVSGSAKATSGENKWAGTVRGTSPSYQLLNGQKAIYGAYFDEANYQSSARVALLGSYAYQKLFPDGGDPTGTDIRINDVSFRVAGVLEERAGNQIGGDDDRITIPLTTARERLFPSRNAKGQTTAGIVLLQAANKDRVNALIEQATEVLRARHNVEFKNEDDFSVASQQDILATFGAVTSAITVFLAAVAGISLFVGGIGIMNIMLVSVTERTREIGLRKAIGARPGIILAQFLIESIVLSVLGGLIGIAAGWALAQFVTLVSQGQFQAIVSVDAVLIAVGFSIIVGAIFGVYPAARAAKLNPIEALRYE
ncbi:MAG TPA: ABC transporter permease [Thermoflexales bacterium]|nr:ABC transporter permease [Thermoflexales bacterium]HQW37056.1 ABC transporter permease [Thermoflexales bacterium]HQZ22859.1 ABC transporter permease [Thermoflexales bacterium]